MHGTSNNSHQTVLYFFSGRTQITCNSKSQMQGIFIRYGHTLKGKYYLLGQKREFCVCRLSRVGKCLVMENP
jgi:hypothetical protein